MPLPGRPGHVRTAFLAAAVLSWGAVAACRPASDEGPAARDALSTARGLVGPDEAYAGLVDTLRAFIRNEMEQKELPGLSIALVDGPKTVWAEGFGWQRREDGLPATSETVYRVGSVSKLFTDIGVMQLVERGVLDLDAPVTQWLPGFQPDDPYGAGVTLRQLMAHRSGLVREPPVGHYFDATSPSLAATVASLSGSPLVYEPGTRTKYSNAAIATVGYVLEVTQSEPFADYLERSVLRPMGLRNSSFEPRPDLVERLATAYMWTYDNRVFEAPTFQLGMAPAGSMYATVTDLARFLSILFAEGQAPDGPVISPESLAEMWTPQFVPDGQETGFGLGFFVSELEGRRLIRHGGAIYGFATELAALPDDGVGVVVAITMDGANTVAGRIADAALRAMLAFRDGRSLPPLRRTAPVPPETAEALEGRYGEGDQAVDLLELGGRLFLEPVRGGFRVELRSLGDTLITDGRLGYGERVIPLADAIVVGGARLPRTGVPVPPRPPERWQGLIGEYGWDHNVLYILEKDARLHALIEWFYLDPLDEISPDVFRFPDGRGLYHGESLVFHRDVDGRATGVTAAGILWERRPTGPEDGGTFQIEPVRPVEELRAVALAAEPPRESGDFLDPDLVELTDVDPSVHLDIRYASTNNFMGARFYDEARAFLQRPAAEALVRAHRSLEADGFGLLVHDGYRPWYVTRMFWDATPEDLKIFVANPAGGSRHNRGGAVDLTLYDRATGDPVTMVSGYDEFSERAFPDYPGGTSRQRWLRELLREAMEDQGFEVYEWEWWHFDYGDWSRYPVQNDRFDAIPGSGG